MLRTTQVVCRIHGLVLNALPSLVSLLRLFSETSSMRLRSLSSASQPQLSVFFPSPRNAPASTRRKPASAHTSPSCATCLLVHGSNALSSHRLSARTRFISPTSSSRRRSAHSITARACRLIGGSTGAISILRRLRDRIVRW